MLYSQHPILRQPALLLGDAKTRCQLGGGCASAAGAGRAGQLAEASRQGWAMAENQRQPHQTHQKNPRVITCPAAL